MKIGTEKIRNHYLNQRRSARSSMSERDKLFRTLRHVLIAIVLLPAVLVAFVIGCQILVACQMAGGL